MRSHQYVSLTSPQQTICCLRAPFQAVIPYFCCFGDSELNLLCCLQPLTKQQYKPEPKSNIMLEFIAHFLIHEALPYSFPYSCCPSSSFPIGRDAGKLECSAKRVSCDLHFTTHDILNFINPQRLGFSFHVLIHGLRFHGL